MKFVAIAVTGVRENQRTQCDYITTALCDDGSIWELRNTSDTWIQLPQLPPLGTSSNTAATSYRAAIGCAPAELR